MQPASQTGEAHCTQSVIEPSKEPSGEENARSRAYPRPDSVPEAVWSDFLKVRRAKKAPVTELAMTGLQREADRAGLTLAQALTVCCEQSWQGFNAGWYANLQARSGSRAATPIPLNPERERNRQLAAHLAGYATTEDNDEYPERKRLG